MQKGWEREDPSAKRRVGSGQGSYQCTWREDAEKSEPDSSEVPSDRIKGNGHKLKHGMYNRNIRKFLSIVGVLKHCRRLLREVVEFPYLHMLKWWLGMVLAPSCRWCLSRLLDQIGSRGPCHLWQLCDSVLCCMNKYFNGRKQMCLFCFGME